MTRLKHNHLAFCAMLAAMSALAAPARAADVHDASMKDYIEPEMARPVWHGLYVGIHAGYGWGSFYPTEVDPIFAVLIEEELEHDPDGGVLGLQLGYNWQRDRWVFGVEGDIAASNIEGDLTYDFDITSVGTDTFTDVQTFDLEYFATLRARIGVDVGSVLVYFTGGLAWAKVDSTFTVTVAGPGLLPDGTISGSDSATYVGYAVGGGAEISLREDVSFKAEYIYADFGEEDHQPVASVPGEPFDLDLHLVRLGINYHF